nr:MAG TPA: hypothetical protein [Caudoviricetes sp.]
MVIDFPHQFSGAGNFLLTLGPQSCIIEANIK